MPSFSSSSGYTSSSLGDLLFGMGNTLFKETQPVTKTLLSQIMEALKTGGVGAQIPEIQSAVTQARTGLAQSMSGAKQALGTMNLGSDPLSSGIMSQLMMQGNQAISDIPSSIARSFISMAPGYTGNLLGEGVRAMGIGAGLNTTTGSSGMGFDPVALISALLGGGGARGYPGGGGGTQSFTSSPWSP